MIMVVVLHSFNSIFVLLGSPHRCFVLSSSFPVGVCWLVTNSSASSIIWRFIQFYVPLIGGVGWVDLVSCGIHCIALHFIVWYCICIALYCQQTLQESSVRRVFWAVWITASCLFSSINFSLLLQLTSIFLSIWLGTSTNLMLCVCHSV